MRKVSRWSFFIVTSLVTLVLVAVACGGAESTSTPSPTATKAPTATVPPPTATTLAGQPTSAPAPTATRPAPTATPSAVPATATATPVRPKVGGTIRTFQSRNQEGHDFHRSRNSTTWVTTAPTLNWLVANWGAEGKLVPDLATSWDLAADGKTYTFHLDPKAKWQDGVPLTADDIVYTIKRIHGDLDLKAPIYASTMASVDTVKALDANTVQVALKQVSASWLPGLGTIGNMVYPVHVSATTYLNNTPFIGSGPYKLQSVTPDIKNVLVRNENYWKTDGSGIKLPYMDEVDIYIIADLSASRSAYLTNQLDYTFAFGSPFKGQIQELKKRVPDSQLNFYWASRGLTWRNVAPLNDQRLRYAVQLALDRSQAAQVWNPGESRPFVNYGLTDGNYSSKWALTQDQIMQLPGLNPATKQQDIAQANKLLDDFLKDIGKTRDTFQVGILTRDIYEWMTLIVQDQMKKALGLKFAIEVRDNPTNVQRQLDGTFETQANGVVASWDDPSDYMAAFFRTGVGLNTGRWSNPEMDATFDKLEGELDVAKRKALAQDTERKLFDLAYATIVVGDPESWVARSYVVGMKRFGQQDNYTGQLERVWMNK